MSGTNVLYRLSPRCAVWRQVKHHPALCAVRHPPRFIQRDDILNGHTIRQVYSVEGSWFKRHQADEILGRNPGWFIFEKWRRPK